MTTLLVGDAEIAAGLAPLGTMRSNPAAASSRVGQQVRKLVAQGAVNLLRAVCAQQWVQRY